MGKSKFPCLQGRSNLSSPFFRPHPSSVTPYLFPGPSVFPEFSPRYPTATRFSQRPLKLSMPEMWLKFFPSTPSCSSSHVLQYILVPKLIYSHIQQLARPLPPCMQPLRNNNLALTVPLSNSVLSRKMKILKHGSGQTTQFRQKSKPAARKDSEDPFVSKSRKHFPSPVLQTSAGLDSAIFWREHFHILVYSTSFNSNYFKDKMGLPHSTPLHIFLYSCLYQTQSPELMWP